jgi:hypothetical protein
MALVVKDRVKETTTTTGTGTVTLAGASTGYQSFSAIGNGNTTYYTISNPGTTEWEVGIGTYTSSGTTLSRDTVLASSNSGSLVTFSAGTKDVFVVYPAGKAIYLDASGNSVALGTPASTTTLTNCTGLPISTGVSGLGTGVATALGNNVNTTGGTVTQSGTLAASALLLGGGSATAITSTTTGTGVVTALGVNTGSSGAFVVNGGVLGTPSSGTVTNLTGTASININGTVGATTPAAGTFTSLSDSGNLTFTGTSNRITGDFTNATVTSRLAFVTSTADSATGIYALPAGTSTAASWQATNNSDPTNASKILIATNASTDVQLVSGINGSGTYLPLSFYNNGAQKMQLSTAGNFGIGVTPSNNGWLELAAGTTSVAPARLTSGTNLTSPVAGSIEYDGTNYYVTPTVGTTEQRGVIPSTQQFVLSAAGSAFGAAIGNFFGSNSAIQLAASTTYSIEAYCYFLKTTAGTATWAPTFSSAPTVTHATIEYTPITGFTTSIITGAMVVAEATAQATATMTFTATGSLTTAVYHVAKFKVFVTTNAATNLRFNVTQSAGTMTPQAGSWYTVRKVATNSGNFVA